MCISAFTVLQSRDACISSCVSQCLSYLSNSWQFWGGKLYECLTCIYLILMICHMSSSYLFFFFIACVHLFAVGWNLLVLVLLFEYYGYPVYILGDWARWSGLLLTELEGVLFSASHCVLCSSLFSLHLCPRDFIPPDICVSSV